MGNMNKKKVLMLVTSLGLIGAIGIGATLAYFTDQDTRTNTFTMGNVDIDLDEYEDLDKEEPAEEGIDYEDVLPGDELIKVAEITMPSTSSDAYLRMQFDLVISKEVNGVSTTVTDQEVIDKVAALAFDSVEDGWVMAPGDSFAGDNSATFYSVEDGTTTPRVWSATGFNNDLFMEKVEVPELEWTNEMADINFHFVFTAEAVQADNFTVDMTAADPWGGVTAEPYPAP